ncbi:MAG: helix-turn-helix transcriptional regulator [Clostridia bacterium]|nr:helix-turn-helix transcriptional regulator [Clostridia bacterium]
MRKSVSFKNRDRLVQLGITIATVRRMRGLSQEKLAEKANVSRSLISTIEAPGMAHSFSIEAFFNIADALDVAPEDLLKASVLPDTILNKKQ